MPLPTPTPLYRSVEKKCSVCFSPLILKNNRDIERKKTCGRSCHWKRIADLHPENKDNLALGRTSEIYKKIGRTLSARIRLGLISKPPLNIRGRKKYFCFSCGEEKLHNNDRCWKCRNLSVNISFFCENCGTEASHKVSRYNAVQHHFCKKSCGIDWKTKQISEAKKEYVCTQCGVLFLRFKSQAPHSGIIFCSVRCRGTWIKENIFGSLSPAYIDGRTPLIKLLRNSAKYEEWRREVLRLSNYRCQHCFVYNTLHAHHKVRFSILVGKFLHNCRDQGIEDIDKMLDLARSCQSLWDFSNGEALCYRCHAAEHPDINLTAKRGGSYEFTDTQ